MLNWEVVPITMDEEAIKIIKMNLLVFININKGIIFCQVNMIAIISHFIDWAKEGIQVWKGAAAILIEKARVAILIGNKNESWIEV